MAGKLNFILVRLGGALLICGGSFWATLKVLDYRDAASTREETKIRLAEATYGANCRAQAGNATELVAKVCGASRGTCSFLVDAAKMGDPAPGCAKDFAAKWKCGNGSEVREQRLQSEASGKVLNIRCP